jgi:hypothetical protein
MRIAVSLIVIVLAGCVVQSQPKPQSAPPAEPVDNQPAESQPETSTAMRIGCVATAGDLGGTEGEKIRVHCTPGCRDKGPVTGTGIYTVDSRVCRTAIHAGVITNEAGGELTVEFTNGASAFSGTEANGVTSSDGGLNPRGMRVER